MPAIFDFLFQQRSGGLPVRHRAAYGGRGSAKSHSFAARMVLRGAERITRAMGTREIQLSIRDSVKELLERKIFEMGLGDFYTVTSKEILGRPPVLARKNERTRITFAGLSPAQANSLKSTEGLDLVWVEEAQTVSQYSVDLLTPTVRKDDSEIWWTWNPLNESDPVDVMFRGKGGPPPGSLVREVSYHHNPFFPEVLRREMEWDRQRDPDKYAWVWAGKYRRLSSATVFRNWSIGSLANVPEGAIRMQGADWGFSVDPSVLVRVWLLPSPNPLQRGTLYIDQEAYGVGVEIDDTPALFAGTDSRKPPRWENRHEYEGITGAAEWPIRADSARPETISYMAKRGFKIVGARKGPGSVEEGVKFLQSYNIMVHPRCKHCIDELTLYSYKVDKLTGIVLPVLQDEKNHVIDALRYAVEDLRRSAVLVGAEVVSMPSTLPGGLTPPMGSSTYEWPGGLVS